jgi:hypothetical protein
MRMGLVGGGEDPSAEHATRAAWVVAVALITALTERGWTLNAMPGEKVTLEREGDVVHPFALIHELDAGELSASAWLALCLRHGVGDLDLGAAAGYEGGAARVSRRWSFIAMSYYGLVLNRTFRVIVTERAVSGARVRGLMSAPASVGPQHDDPEFYVGAKLDAAYAELDPESEEFLARDRANFRIDRDQIERVELIERAKWGMGTLPAAGRVMLHLRDGTRRELILLGRPNAAAIVRGLARTEAPVAG